MKTQLMHDILESSGVALPAPRRSTLRHAAPSGPDGAAAATAVPPSRPPPAGDSPPPPPPLSSPSSAPSPSADAAMPDWLVERLRDDAAQAELAQLRSRRQRRAAHWGIGAVVLAVLAAGGLQLAEENRVDGALHRVASMAPADTAPVPAGPMAPIVVTMPAAPAPPPATPPPTALQPTAAPADTPVGVRQSAAAGQPAVGQPAVEQAGVEQATVEQATVDQDQRAAPAVIQSSPPPRRVAAVRTPAPAVSRAGTRRREETLMQCRAHGYDERQCAQRACTMTRYGFACRG